MITKGYNNNVWKDANKVDWAPVEGVNYFSIQSKSYSWYFGLYSANGLPYVNYNAGKRFLNTIKMDGTNIEITSTSHAVNLTGYFRYNSATDKFRYFNKDENQPICLYRLED